MHKGKWRRQWRPTPVLLPGESRGQGSLVGCSPWGCWGSDTTERLHFHFSLSCTGEGNGNPLQCSCLEHPRDGGALVGCHLWGRTGSDTTEATQHSIAKVNSQCIITPKMLCTNIIKLHLVSSLFNTICCSIPLTTRIYKKDYSTCNDI